LFDADMRLLCSVIVINLCRHEQIVAVGDAEGDGEMPLIIKWDDGT